MSGWILILDCDGLRKAILKQPIVAEKEEEQLQTKRKNHTSESCKSSKIYAKEQKETMGLETNIREGKREKMGEGKGSLKIFLRRNSRYCTVLRSFPSKLSENT